MEEGMLAELDVVIFLKSSDGLEQVAGRVFAALGTPHALTEPDESGTVYYQGSGMGFRALLFANTGEMLDPEFEDYQYGMEITSQFWDIELDTLDLDDQLSEYFARLIAFELNLETATEILVETTEESEIFEIRAYRRNPQYRMDQSPTIPRVFIIETRQVEASLEEEWETEQDDGTDVEESGSDLEEEPR
jgi:hypothetical protein